MTKSRYARPLLAALTVLALAGGLAACGEDTGGDSTSAATTAKDANAIQKNTANSGTTLTIGSKNFTEQKVLGEVYAQALAAAGYTTKTELNLGDEKTALKALQGGQISGYPEYTGTALASFLDVKANDIPKDPQQAYADVKSGLAEQGVTALPPTPFTSSNEVAVTKATADKLGLKNISDLEGKAQNLTLYGSPECRQRTDCLLGLQQVYGLQFKKFVPVDIALRHEVLSKGQADVSIVFTTDPQIKREGFVLLKDDKGMFPPYNSTFLIKTSTLDKAGTDVSATIASVNKNLTADTLQELNARVDLDKQTPQQAAAAYLKEFGYVQ